MEINFNLFVILIVFSFFYIDLRKVYPYYFTFTTFTKGRWVNEKILDVFAREFRAHPAEEYERCINAGTLTVNYEKVPIDYKLKHNDLLANIVHRYLIIIYHNFEITFLWRLFILTLRFNLIFVVLDSSMLRIIKFVCFMLVSQINA